MAVCWDRSMRQVAQVQVLCDVNMFCTAINCLLQRMWSSHLHNITSRLSITGDQVQRPEAGCKPQREAHERLPFQLLSYASAGMLVTTCKHCLNVRCTAAYLSTLREMTDAESDGNSAERLHHL